MSGIEVQKIIIFYSAEKSYKPNKISAAKKSLYHKEVFDWKSVYIFIKWGGICVLVNLSYKTYYSD